MGDTLEFCHSCKECNKMVQKLYEHLCRALDRNDLKIEFKITAPQAQPTVLTGDPDRDIVTNQRRVNPDFMAMLKNSWLTEDLPDENAGAHDHETRRKTGEASLDGNVFAISANTDLVRDGEGSKPNSHDPDDYWLPPDDPRYDKVLRRRKELGSLFGNTNSYLIRSKVSKDALVKKYGPASGTEKTAILKVCKEGMPVTSRVEQGVQTDVSDIRKQSKLVRDSEPSESDDVMEPDGVMWDEDTAAEENPHDEMEEDSGLKGDQFDPFARSDAVISDAMSTLQNPPSSMQGVECVLCGEWCMSPMFLRFHEEDAHKRDGYFHCNKCEAVFPRRNQIIDHMERHDGRMKHLCPHCGQAFVTRYDYMKHVNKQHTERKTADPGKVILCAECGYSTNQAKKLRQHVLAKHTDGKRERCPLCSFATKLRSNLRIHVRKHHEEHFRTYFPEPHSLRCIHCPYRVFSNNQYIRHMKNEHPDRNAVAYTRKGAIRLGLGGSVEVINEADEPEEPPEVGMIAREYVLAFKDDGSAFVVGSC